MLTLFADLSPAAAVGLSAGVYVALSAPVVLLAPTEFDAKAAALDGAITLAALLMLLTAAPEASR